MRELSNEEALDLFADLMEPVAEILTDDDVKRGYAEKPIKGIRLAIKRHKRTWVKILALLDGVPESKYQVNVLTLPMKVLELVNRPDFQPIVQELFQLQDQMTAVDASGPATEPTGDGVE